MFNFEQLFKNLQKTEECRVLNDKEIGRLEYKFFPNSIVWVIETEMTYKGVFKLVIFYLNFPNDFPYSLPKVFIKKEIYENLKYVPHVNKDYSICIFDDGLNSTFSNESLNEIVEYIIHQAKEIIKNSENTDYNTAEFNKEFKAYWEIEYGSNDKVSNLGLHLLKSFGPEYVKGIRLENKLSNYEYVLYNEGNEWDSFKKYLEYRKIQYVEISVFVIEKAFAIPPYNLTFKQSLELLKKNDIIFDNFKSSIKKSNFNGTLVAFFNKINSKIEVYGWTYSELIAPLNIVKGARGKPSNWQILDHPIFGKSNVSRITFDNLTTERLQLRTSGVIEENKSIAICGLGSVGSNLIHFLRNLSINKFHLIDEENLKLENINRHYSGFININQSKVSAIKDHLLKLNPFYEIDILKSSIQTVINENPNFINDCDFHIVCIGRTMIESYILGSLLENKITKPIFLFWVEPYLASGQMIFINPKDVEKAILLVNNFKYNVLSNRTNNSDKTYLKEGSCQSGYFPYSSTYLTLFLSSIFQYLKLHIVDGNEISTTYTWIGNKDFLQSKGLELTHFATQNNSYCLIINSL